MAPKKILVADDDAWILRMVTTVLEKRGYEVTTATDGQEAFDTAVAESPDLLITDVMMPNLDGWGLIKALRARPEFAFIPVIFLTALTGDDDRIQGFRLGADDYLPKPFRFEELDLRVTKTLERTASLEKMAREKLGATGAGEQSQAGADEGSSALTGSLEQVGLSALLILLEMERKSGILKIKKASDDSAGLLYLKDGNLVDAEVANQKDLKGETCVYHVLGWTEGTFQFELQDIERENVVNSNTTHLLMEAARLMDEQNNS